MVFSAGALALLALSLMIVHARTTQPPADDPIPTNPSVADSASDYNPYTIHGHHAHPNDHRSSSTAEEQSVRFADLPDEIANLTADLLKDKIEKTPLLLVFFYVPWSVACQNYVREFASIARELYRMKPRIRTAMVDVSLFPAVGREYRVNSFPFLSAFRDGIEAPNAEGAVPTDHVSVIRHMRGLLRPSIFQVNSKQEAASYVNPQTGLPVYRLPIEATTSKVPKELQTPPVVFGFLDNAANEEHVLRDVSVLLQHQFVFIWTDDDFIAKQYKRKLGEVAVYGGRYQWQRGKMSHVDEKTGSSDASDDVPMHGPAVFSNETHFLRNDVLKFVVDASLPLLAVFEESNQKIYLHRRKPMVVYFTHHLGPQGKHYDLLLEVAKRHTDDYTFVQAHPFKNDRLLSFLDHVEFHAEHQFALGMFAGKIKHRYVERTLTIDKLEKFLADHADSKLPVHYKTEPEHDLPAYGGGAVFQLTHSNFRQHVVEPTNRDAVILFYKPHEPNSLPVIDTMDEIADYFKDVKALVVAKVDITQNDFHPEFEIPGVPSIVYCAVDKKSKPVRMFGPRDFNSILKFIKEQAAVKLRKEGTSPSLRPPSPIVRDEM